MISESGADVTSELDFTGKVVLVTGGGRGVGRGITEAFAGRGARVVICGRNAPEPGKFPDTVEFVACDVREDAQVGELIDGIVAKHGRLDVVVNNAGGTQSRPAATSSARYNTQIVMLNLMAPIFVSTRANTVMQNQPEGGCIINISSVSGMRPTPNTAAYGAAKAGLVNLTTTLAMEWAPKVRVNALTAGLVKTELAHLFYGDEAGVAAVDATVPMGRMADPSDIGDACLYLASPLAKYVTGANLQVHGGGEPPPYIGAGNAG